MQPYEQVLRFWFGPDSSQPLSQSSRWFTRSEAFDQQIEKDFGELWQKASRGELDSWAESPRGALALIVLLDQFSRNLFRGSPQAFSQDEKAQKLCLQALKQGTDAQLSLVERWFLLMPLMHAEDRRLQKMCVEGFERLLQQAPPESKDAFAGALMFARRHQEIIDRFGRFPHRNATLGRETTAEEKAFLLEPNSSF